MEFGIMQSRLTNPVNYANKYQFCPSDSSLIAEFYKAKSLGIDYIEWVVDNPVRFNRFKYGYINSIIESTGVGVRAVCIDYFVDNELDKKELLFDNCRVLFWTLCTIRDLFGDEVVVTVPILKKIINWSVIYELLNCMSVDNGLKLCFETDCDIETTIKEIKRLCVPVSITYDIGNAQGNGRDVLADLELLLRNNLLGHIHIKEKVAGESVPLGKSNLDWNAIFNMLRTYNYGGYLTLQCAREEPGEEYSTVKNYVEFMRGFL